MKILAIEFSSSLRSVALVNASGTTVETLGRAEEQHGQTTHAFAMIEAVLKQAGLAPEGVDCLAIGLGPGSYAGIRVSLAIAQGWQLATGVKTIGISSVACLAETARIRGQRGGASFIVDAQRGEFYLADYQLSETGCLATRPLGIVGKAEVEQRLAAGVAVFGPEATSAFAGSKDLYPEAEALALLAAPRTEFVAAAELQPIYLRPVAFVKAPKPNASLSSPG